jgi:uncharacterized coiled-coil protein SlyX
MNSPTDTLSEMQTLVNTRLNSMSGLDLERYNLLSKKLVQQIKGNQAFVASINAHLKALDDRDTYKTQLSVKAQELEAQGTRIAALETLVGGLQSQLEFMNQQLTHTQQIVGMVMAEYATSVEHLSNVIRQMASAAAEPVYDLDEEEPRPHFGCHCGET